MVVLNQFQNGEENNINIFIRKFSFFIEKAAFENSFAVFFLFLNYDLYVK